MASVSNDPGGCRRLTFVDKARTRKTIWLGKVSQRDADKLKTRVEEMNNAAIEGRSVERETAEWLGKIGDALHAKLAKVGLTTPRQPPTPPAPVLPLGAFLANYIDRRTDVAPNTRRNLLDSRARLVAFFGAGKALRDITPADGDNFLLFLKEKYADSTTGRTVKRAKQFFRDALRGKLIAENPFADVKAPSQVNESRMAFIDLETAYKVLDACPDAEWRLLFALSRFGGLRCPSEHLVITWADMDWERSRFRVDSPKTGVRWVPIFAELKPYLEEAWELAPEGAVHVIARYRDANCNLRTQMLRIIKRAGLKPWPKLFHNLRATRETELAASHPIHVVCSWLGHDAAIAQKHYLQVTDQDFERAANSAPHSVRDPETARQTSQHGERTEHARNDKTPVLSGVSAKSADFSEVDQYPQGDSKLPLKTREARQAQREALDSEKKTDKGTAKLEKRRSGAVTTVTKPQFLLSHQSRFLTPISPRSLNRADHCDNMRTHSAHLSHLEWLGPSPLSADQLVAATDTKPGRSSTVDDAIDFLTALLDDGPRCTLDIWQAAKERGIHRRTLQRIRSKIGIRTKTVWSRNRTLTYWLLPEQRLPTDIAPAPADVPSLEPWLAPLRAMYPPDPLEEEI